MSFSSRTNYTVLGIILGLLFPVAAYIATLTDSNYSFSLSNIALIHQENFLLYFIDTAPFFLALMAWIAGYNQDSLKSKTSDKLSQRDHLMNAFMDALPAGIFVITADGVPYYANQRSKEILGKGIFPETNTDDLAEVYKAYKASTQELYPTAELPLVLGLHGQSTYIEDMEIHHEGVVMPLEVWGKPVRDNHGTITHSIAIFNDISKRKKSEDELRESRAFLDSVVENIPNMLFVKDAKDLRFVRFNKAGEKLIGVDRSAMVGKTDYDFFPKEQADLFTQKDREVFEKGELVDIPKESIQTTFKGTRILHTQKVPVYNSQGKPAFLLGISEDITSSIEAQNTLNEYIEKLEKANRDLDQFAYIVSHDLKAPLRGIASLSDWIKEDFGGELPDEINQHLDMMKGRVIRMENLINGILEYSRAGKSSGEPSILPTKEFIKGIVDLIRSAENHQIIFAGEFHPISGDKVQLTQVFSNLIGNAMKYNDGEKSEIIISMRDMGAKFEFSIKDNGQGIEPQFHERIFGIFQRIDSRDKVEGTGIGLAIVKKIIEENGGKVWLESELGKGANFIFTWPKD